MEVLLYFSLNYPTQPINYPTRPINYPTRPINYPTRAINYPTRPINDQQNLCIVFIDEHRVLI